MTELLGTFRRKAEELVATINQKGGISTTIDTLRRQMEASDRRRNMTKVKTELRRLDTQITEMITAVGVQAVGLHKSGHLTSPELAPLCAHIVQLEEAVARQKVELAKLEVQMRESAGPAERACPACRHTVPDAATFCPYCGTALPAPVERFCAHCGAPLRPAAQFCARCGQAVGTPQGS